MQVLTNWTHEHDDGIYFESTACLRTYVRSSLVYPNSFFHPAIPHICDPECVVLFGDTQKSMDRHKRVNRTIPNKYGAWL